MLVLAGCSSAVRWDPAPRGEPRAGRQADAPAVHVVRSGETLYSIARRYGLRHQDLARWNGLGDGSLIRVGQRLRLAPAGGRQVARAAAPPRAGGTAAASDLPAPRWQWPAEGAVIAAFGQSPMTASGIQIGGRLGQAVRAAADGRVVYSGTGLTGYGALLIVKHSDTWLSAYGHNQALLVAEGEAVRAGQEIARIGEGPGRRPVLHFEIRRNGSPVDPLTQLPGR